MKKRYMVLGAVAVICAGAYYLTPSLSNIVKSVVHKYGSQITGTDVSLQGFSLSLSNGEGSISGLTVANPQGYKAPNLISLGDVSVKVNLKSLTTNTIIIDEIKVNKPVITYEMLSLTQNNIKQIQSNIAKNTASAEKAEAKDEAPKATDSKTAEKSSPAKKVIIKLVSINGGEIQAVANVAGKENSTSVKFPAIEIRGLGEAHNGQSIAASISQILTKILNTAAQSVVDNKLGDLKGIAEENLNNVLGGVKDRVKLKGIFAN